MIISSIARQKYFLIIILSLILLCPSLVLANAEWIFKENSSAVVVVMTYDAKNEPLMQGSGFIVRADGAIVTNYHVISGASDIKVKAGDKILAVEGLIYEDKENDLVILKAEGENLPIVKIGDGEKTGFGKTVFVISSAHGLPNTITDSILEGIRYITSSKKVLKITSPESSGKRGVIFNKIGEAIGIVTFLVEEEKDLIFAMPLSGIKDKINNKNVTPLKGTIAENDKETADHLFNDGIARRNSGEVNEAIEAFKRAIRINPDFAEAHYNLGVLYVESGMHAEAIESYKEAIRIKPDFAEVHYNLGNVYGKSGMQTEAIESYKQAIQIKPDYVNAHNNLAVAYDGSGMHTEAIESYKQAIRIKPDFAEAHNGLGVSYTMLGKHQEAIDAYKQAIGIRPDFALAHYNLGISYLLINDKDSAFKEHEILKEIDKEMASKLSSLMHT